MNGLDRSVQLSRQQPAVRMGQDPSLHYYPKKGFRLSKKVCSPLAPSARGLRPQAVGERTVWLPEIFRAMARFSPSAPSGHLPRRGFQRVGADSISARKACHCRRRPRATNGRPYKTKAHPAHSCRMSCGWVGEVRTHECGSQSPVPYHLATTHYKRKGRAGTRLYGLWWGA